MSSGINVPLTLLTDKIVSSSLIDTIVAVALDNDPVIVSPFLNVPEHFTALHDIVRLALAIVIN